jgi:putative hydrolase of the HAD superfamily
MNLANLEKKLTKFDILIFDLDDTVYPQKNYDTPALLSVSKFIQKKTNLKILDIFKKLRKLKKIRRGNPPKFLFNIFFKNIEIKYKNFIVAECVRLFQSYKCKELKKSKSLKFIIEILYKTKILFLVTNGNIERQNNKIKYLGIKKYFRKIFILDGVKKEAKPSTNNVQSLVKFINIYKDFKAVYIGDNLISDKKFARNLKISFIHFEFPFN